MRKDLLAQCARVALASRLVLEAGVAGASVGADCVGAGGVRGAGASAILGFVDVVADGCFEQV